MSTHQAASFQCSVAGPGAAATMGSEDSLMSMPTSVLNDSDADKQSCYVGKKPLPEPITDPDQLAALNIQWRDYLGGVLHEYEHAA